jgi:hypothetical protein
MLTQIIRPRTAEGKQYLDEVIGRSRDPSHLNLLWYPSAGKDFRDIIEFSPARLKDRYDPYNIEVPDIYLHTDYNAHSVELNPGIIYQDAHTCVTINQVHKLEVTRNIAYDNHSPYADRPYLLPIEPQAFLLMVTNKSDSYGSVVRPVIYFYFENINFLKEVLLRHQIKVSHFVKVVEGCSFGGNRKSVSVAYPFLSELGTKYLMIDDEIHYDVKLALEIQKELNIQPMAYRLSKLNKEKMPRWNHVDVNLFLVKYSDRRLDLATWQFPDV